MRIWTDGSFINKQTSKQTKFIHEKNFHEQTGTKTMMSFNMMLRWIASLIIATHLAVAVPAKAPPP